MFVTLESWKMPNHANTWSRQTASTKWKQIWKIPSHERDLAKRWRIPQFPVVTCPPGYFLWKQNDTSVTQKPEHKAFCFLGSIVRRDYPTILPSHKKTRMFLEQKNSFGCCHHSWFQQDQVFQAFVVIPWDLSRLSRGKGVDEEKMEVDTKRNVEKMPTFKPVSGSLEWYEWMHTNVEMLQLS